jgi:predicted HicB family RNase H-like nuclease
MMYRGFTAQLAVDPDENLIKGKVLGIQSDIRFSGSTVPEVKALFEEAVNDLISAGEVDGEKSYKGQIAFRTDSQTHREIALAAEKEGLSVNGWMEKSLQEAARRTLLRSEGVEDPHLLHRLIVEDRYASIEFFSAIDGLLKRTDLFGLAEAMRQFILLLDEALSQITPYLNRPEDMAVVWLETAQVIGRHLDKHGASQKHYAQHHKS